MLAHHQRLVEQEAEIADIERQQREEGATTGALDEPLLQLKRELRVEEGKRAEKQKQLLAKPVPEPGSSQTAAALAPWTSTSLAASASDDVMPTATMHPGTDRGSSSAAAILLQQRGASRRARVVLGVCLPRFIAASVVMRHVVALHERVCTFADVVVVCSEDVIADVEAAEAFERALLSASLKAKAACESAELTVFLTPEDGRRHADGHMPKEAAASVARWGDVLLIAPLCGKYLVRLANTSDEDLLSELALLWGYSKLKGGEYVPTKPFIIAPRMNTLVKQHPSVENFLLTLTRQGIEVGAHSPALARGGWALARCHRGDSVAPCCPTRRDSRARQPWRPIDVLGASRVHLLTASSHVRASCAAGL